MYPRTPNISNGAIFEVDSGSKVGVRASYYLSTCLMHPLGTLACQIVVSVHFSTIPCPYKARANSTLEKGVHGPGLLGHHAFTTWILSKRSRIQAQCLSKNLHITNPPTKHCHRYTKFAGYTSVFCPVWGQNLSWHGVISSPCTHHLDFVDSESDLGSVPKLNPVHNQSSHKT